MYAWVDHYRPLRAALGTRRRASAVGGLAGPGGGRRQRPGGSGRGGAGRPRVVRQEHQRAPARRRILVRARLRSHRRAADRRRRRRRSPVPDGCGSCQRCLTACPTGALVGAGQLDARRCLAWLLQAPGVFPPEFRVALGDRMYGCDDCQTVCPINRLATRRHPPDDVETRPLSCRSTSWNCSALGDGPLMDLVGRWYIPGREPRYVRRNALVVLGNTADPSDPAVEAALTGALCRPGPDHPVPRRVGGRAARAARSAPRPDRTTPTPWCGRAGPGGHSSRSASGGPAASPS